MLDRLARRAARRPQAPPPRVQGTALTRRAVLRRALGATAGAGLGAVTIGAAPAAADCCGGQCTEGCCTGNSGLGCCSNPYPDTCPVCYQADEGDHCCYGTDSFGEAAVWACPQDSVCWQGWEGGQELCDDCTPTGGTMCRNGDCCHAPNYCYTFEGENMCTGCVAPLMACGGTDTTPYVCCDPSTEDCVNGKCHPKCTEAEKCGGNCCPDGQFCCGSSRAKGFCCGAQEANRENRQICQQGADTLQDVSYLMVLAAIAFKLMGAPWATIMAKGESGMYAKTAAELKACANGTAGPQAQARAALATPGGSFRSYARPPRSRPVHVGAEGHIDAAAARALNAMLSNEGQTQALVQAWTDSIARAQAAASHGSRQWTIRQVRAAAKFALQAAAGYDRDIDLRRKASAALRHAGARELTPTVTQVAAIKAQISAHGLPADIVAALRSAGLSTAQIAALQAGLLAAPDDSLARPALLAPLVDPTALTNARRMAAALRGYARSAKRNPLARG
ncbi:MAG: hypothetical protein ACRDMJ_03075 [Solirubrobacteraceae bacterium]